MNDMTIMMNEYYVIVINQCRCLPKAELNTKTNPNGHHSVAVWVRFGVQLDYSCRLKSVPSDAEKIVHPLYIESRKPLSPEGRKYPRWGPLDGLSILYAIGEPQLGFQKNQRQSELSKISKTFTPNGKKWDHFPCGSN